jgi:hypothetical protein
MNHEEIIRQLKAPFPFAEVEAKIQVTNGDKSKGMAVFYLDARAVHERLDKVLGAFNWRNEYIKWNEKSQICGLSIYNAERGEWITKFDGAENSDIEPIKGGLTDALKRSAVLWGIGRYLYQMEGVWVEVEQRGKGSFIKNNQQGILKAEYEKAVARMFGVTVSQPNTPATLANDNVVPNAPAVPSVDTEQQPAYPAEYWVQSIKPSGEKSQLLELVNPGGEVVSAYIRNGDNAIMAGVRLRDVAIVRKDSSYGQYNLINAYKVAA